MTIVFNLLCKAFIAILDILLLDFYLKNVYPDIYHNKVKKLCNIVYSIKFLIFIFFLNFQTAFYFNLVIYIFIIIIFHHFKVSFTILIKNLILFISIKAITYYLDNLFFSWILDTRIAFGYIDFSSPYTLLVYFITIYLTYILFIAILQLNSHLNFQKFKITTILIFIYFSLNFIINNPVLFLTKSIARTYIFTIVISIIALICFDRMQTKYEKDKHLQESIIQNLEKEKEFNQQREQQQKEIRKINHNLNNILIILQSHLEKEEYEEAKDYIEQNLKTHVEAYQALTHTGIAAIDGALNAHIQSIKEKGIQYDEDISKILHLGSIVPGDLALIISLALDNAKEACENIDGEKHISLKLQSKQTHVILYIENSIPEGSHPSFHKTSKKDKIAHGFGVSSIKEMAERYHGEAKYEVNHDQVILRVVLQK